MMNNFERLCIHILDNKGVITKEELIEFGYDEEHYDKLTKIMGTERIIRNAKNALKEMGITYNKEVSV